MTRTHGKLVILAALILLIAGCGDDSPVAPVADRVSTPSMVPDTAPPTTPTGVCAQVRPRQVKLGWDPNVTDSDCAGFLLSRTAYGGTVQLIAEPLDVTVFIDTHPFAGVAVYEVRAVDAAGNASAAASFVVDYYASGVERDYGL